MEDNACTKVRWRTLGSKGALIKAIKTTRIKMRELWEQSFVSGEPMENLIMLDEIRPYIYIAENNEDTDADADDNFVQHIDSICSIINAFWKKCIMSNLKKTAAAIRRQIYRVKEALNAPTPVVHHNTVAKRDDTPVSVVRTGDDVQNARNNAARDILAQTTQKKAVDLAMLI